MKELYLLRGLPGSGKSTIAKSIGGIHIEADQYFTDGFKFKFDSTKLILAHKFCQDQTKKQMLSECVASNRIVVSNTFTQAREMKAYYDLAKKHRYTVYSLIVENRHNGVNTHNVPDATIKQMKDRFEIKLK
jgi:predicted kinase